MPPTSIPVLFNVSCALEILAVHFQSLRQNRLENGSRLRLTGLLVVFSEEGFCLARYSAY
jgi:hypothetical protein